MNLDSYLVKQEISRFECVHPCIYASYDILDRMDDEELANKIREHLIAIEDAFVNSQEWTLSRSVTEVKIAFVGSPASGKSALVHFFLTGVYIHDESPEGGRFKKLCFNSIQPYLLLIRDEAGPPDFQLASWIDAIVFVVSLADIKSVQIANDYYSLLCNMRELSFVPVVIVATQDAVVNTAPPSGIEDFVRQLVNKMGRCPYYETCAVNGLNVEQVFQEVASRVFAIRSQQWSLQHTRFFASQSSGSSAATNQSGTNLKPAVDNLPISSDDIRELSHKKVVQLSAQKFGGAQLTRFSVVNGPNPEAHGQPYPTTDSRGHSLTDQWSEPVTTGPNSPASVAYTEYITGTMRPPNPINPVSCSQPHAAHITPATIMSLHPAFNRSLFPSAGQVPALHLLQPTSNLRISGSPRSMLPVQATLHSSWIYQPATLQPNSKPSADPMKSTIEPTALPVPLAALTLSESPSGHLLQSIQGSVLQTSHSPLPTELSMQLAPNQQHLGQDWTLTQRGRSDCIKESFPCLNAVIRNEAFSNTLQPKGQTMGVQFQSVPVVSNPSQASHSSQPTPSPPVSSAQMQDRRLSNVFHRPEVEISSGNPGKSSIGPVTQNVSRHSDEHKRDRPRPQSTGSLGSPLVDLTSATICTGGLHTNAVVSPKHRDNLGAGRLIPLKQGYLYKRSIKGISKETRKKKKYVVITEDARLTYHPSKQDYVNGQSSKSIDLTISTIKVPGLAYRMSSFTASTGTPESTPGSQAPAEMNSSFILPSLASSVTSTSTPKGRASEAAPNSANSPSASLWKTRVEKNGNVEFIVITANNTQWHFEAPSTAIRDEWIQQIDLVIHNRLRAGTTARISCEIGAGKSPYKGTNEEDSNPRTSHGRPLSFASPNAGDLKEGGGEDVCGQEEVLQRLTALAGNNCCADCGAPNPEWASLNLVVLICIECSGVHRELGTHISRVRSATLDTWTREHLAVMASFGNTLANSVWEAAAPSQAKQFTKPEPSSPREVRAAWIQNKYVRRLFLPPLPQNTRPVQQELADALMRRDCRSLLHCIALAGRSPANADSGTSSVLALSAPYIPGDSRTALHLAASLGDLAALQLLLWHGAEVNILDRFGLTAWSYAHLARQDACARLLQLHGCHTVSPIDISMEVLYPAGELQQKFQSSALADLAPISPNSPNSESDSLSFSSSCDSTELDRTSDRVVINSSQSVSR